MSIVILLCLLIGFGLFFWVWLVKDNDPNLQQIPLFLIGTLLILIGLVLLVGLNLFRFFTGG